tara:strand:+ start:989 stop:1321 length:333 start_codon:yes stop_codon:yes gene_type:complete
MFDSIIERLISYKRIIIAASSKHLTRAFNVLKNINGYIYIILKKIRYQIEIKRELYYLGKYVSKLDKKKYDLTKDKFFIESMENIKYKNILIDKNSKDLSLLYKKDKMSK